MSVVKSYASRLPSDAARRLAEAKKVTGLSVNDLIVQCVRINLATVASALAPKPGRVTNVEPLPKAVLDRIYSTRKDDTEGLTAKQLAAMQSQTDPFDR